MFKGSETVSLSDTNPALAPRHKYLGEKALHLRIVEEFLTQMEFTLLKGATGQFDLGPVKSSIAELRSLADDEITDRRKRVEFQLAHELLRWQEDLAARDEKIEAYHIRRYCDGLRRALDAEVFVAMARFYRDLPRTRNSLSKFDLALTRAFSSQVSDIFRAISMPRQAIEARLASLYCSWDRVASVTSGSPRDVVVFDKFLEESDSISDFQTLTSSRLFDRIREYKSELGDRFWDPSVAAAAVECNIVVGNHLNGLMARASENLGERLGSEFDFAGAFQDSSTNTGTYISDALRRIDGNGELITAGSESDDLKFLRSLLDLTDSIRSEGAGAKIHEADSPESEIGLSTDTPEFRNALALLEQHNPPTKQLIDLIDSCGFDPNFSLDDFLFKEDEMPDEIGREIFGIIISLETLRTNELQERQYLPGDVRNKVMELLRKAETLGNKLEASIIESSASSGRRLKIANRLLETRLRCERSVFKFTSRGLGILPPEAAADKIGEQPGILSQVEYRSFSANRWVVGATVAAAVISGILYFSTTSADTAVVEDVEIFQTEKMPGGEQLTGAHRQAETLYVVAADEWSDRTEEEKTEALKALLETEAKGPINSVLVIDGQGRHLAEMSQNGMTISPRN